MKKLFVFTAAALAFAGLNASVASVSGTYAHGRSTIGVSGNDTTKTPTDTTKKDSTNFQLR